MCLAPIVVLRHDCFIQNLVVIVLYAVSSKGHDNHGLGFRRGRANIRRGVIRFLFSTTCLIALSIFYFLFLETAL